MRCVRFGTVRTQCPFSLLSHQFAAMRVRQSRIRNCVQRTYVHGVGSEFSFYVRTVRMYVRTVRTYY